MSYYLNMSFTTLSLPKEYSAIDGMSEEVFSTWRTITTLYSAIQSYITDKPNLIVYDPFYTNTRSRYNVCQKNAVKHKEEC